MNITFFQQKVDKKLLQLWNYLKLFKKMSFKQYNISRLLLNKYTEHISFFSTSSLLQE